MRFLQPTITDAPRRAVVAGAGLIGLATAFELRRRGVAVSAVDPEPAGGATRAAAGMLAPVAETQYGQEPLYPLMAASAAEYPAFVERAGAASGLPTGYRTEETLVVAADAADALALAICHVWRGGATDRLAAARERAVGAAVAR